MNKTLRHLAAPALAALALCAAPLTVSAQTEVAIFSINDFHGSFVRNDEKGIVGAPAIWQTLDSLKAVYPHNITVSAGDNFGGSYFYNATHGTLLPVFFNDLGIRLSAVGNHEFDDGQDALAKKWNGTPGRPTGWDITYVCANTRYAKSGEVPPYFEPYVTVPVELPNGKTLTVGFAGLLTSATPLQASARRLVGLSFDGRYNAVLDSVLSLPQAAPLREAAVKLLLTHIGTKTGADGKPLWFDRDSAELEKIDTATWKGFISSHTHERVCGHINGGTLPVVQGRWHGDFISYLVCTVDTATMRVTSVTPHSQRVTPKARLAAGPAKLQEQIDSLLRNTRTAGGTPIGEQLAVATHTLRHDRSEKFCQTELGTLVCKAYAEAFRAAAKKSDKEAIVGCSHFGSIRAGLIKGKISVLDVGEALPFSNRLNVYRVTAKHLKGLVDFGLHNTQYGWIQTGNLEISSDKDGNVTQLVYVSPQGKRRTLKDTDTCYIVADEFMTNGGDGYDKAFFPQENAVQADGVPATTDAFIDYLKKLKQI